MSTDPTNVDPPAEGRGRTLLLVHGRGIKPPAETLISLWQRALAQGLSRDHKIGLENVNVELVYYGEIAEQLESERDGYDPALDLADRENALRRLSALGSAKAFKRTRYEALPGQSPIREFMADVGAPLARLIGLGRRRIARYLPELDRYWQDQSLADELRRRVREPLSAAFERGDHIMVVSHCMGSVLCYDAFWELTDQAADSNHRIHTWITLGAPLADDDVRRRLAGYREGYPNVLINWFNVAAEDDPFCHDETVANDFAGMLKAQQISAIKDYRIYNLTERFGSSDPHGSLGYLLHPRTSRLLADWLNVPIDI